MWFLQDEHLLRYARQPAYRPHNGGIRLVAGLRSLLCHEFRQFDTRYRQTAKRRGVPILGEPQDGLMENDQCSVGLLVELSQSTIDDWNAGLPRVDGIFISDMAK